MISGLIHKIEEELTVKIIGITKINAGYVNDVYKLQTLSNSCYILKIFRLSNTQKIDLSISLQEFISANGLSPKIISKGNLPANYIIQEHICQDNFIVNWAMFGKTLGLLHEHLNQYMNSAIPDFEPEQSSFDLALQNNCNEAQELFLLKKCLKKIIHHPKVDHKQFIHGDYTLNNVLYDRGNYYSVIDFDESKKYYSIYDVSKVILGLITQNTEQSWIDIKNFIRAYESVRRISALEKEEFLNIYVYTLVNDYSGINKSWNKDNNYIHKRIQKHKEALLLINERNDIERKMPW